MADLVLGIAKPLVLGTLNRVQLAIEEESKFKASTQRDLVFITGEFQMMQSFLSAITEENVKSQVVSTWVTQVRDLAYDVEDGIEFVVHLDKKRDWLFRVVPRFMRPSLPLDEAVDIIEQLKARVRDVSQRNERYSLISDSGTISGKETNHNEAAAEAGDTAQKQWDMEALTKLITKEKSGQVISVWATNGDLAGAASIIKKAYDNSKSWGKFEWRAWVKLVRPFNLAGFIKSLLDQFNAYTREEQQRSIYGTDAVKRKEMHVDQEELVKEFKKQVNEKACLVVLEDVSTKEELDTILEYLRYDNKNRIFVSTKHLMIARLCTGSPCFQRFSADQSHCVFFKKGPLIGRMPEVEQLRDRLANARVDGLQVISVWGVAGAGKSSLVRNLYINKHQTNDYKRYIWVDASHPFSLQYFCRSLLLQFHSDSLKANEVDPVIDCNEDPVRKCQGLLRDHQCLLVVDNLRSTKDWDSIHDALEFRPSGSVIVVITNEERTALHCADRKDYIFNVKALEDEEAVVDLFKRQVKRNIQQNELPKQLIPKCGGLPEVIVAIADDLARVFTWMQRANTVNNQFMTNLETSHNFACLRDLFGWIHSYFRSCPDILKPCIFYLSIFPQSQIIRRRRLVMRWVAEGYSKDNASDTAEESGEELFQKITELSMIQPAERTTITNIRMVRCKINAFFQEYIKSRPTEDNVAFALEVCSLKGCCRPTTARTGRHIAIEESWQRDKIVFESIDFSRLRSLTVFGEWKSYFISENMKVLRVLDLENATGVTDDDLKEMLKLLSRLKFLSLSGCRGIRNLPCSVGDLRQLQILDLRYTSIVTMPASITKLKKLQYLRAGTTVPPEDASAPVFKVSKLRRFLKPAGVEVASGVGKLTKLHTLGFVNVGSAGGKDILNEIKNLTQLRKLGVFGVDMKNRKEFYSAISDHSHLQSLSVWFNKDYCLDGMTSESIPETTEPPKKLQSLKLYGLANKLPEWINNEQLRNLRKMNLEIDISQNDLNVIGNLPELCILRLRVKPPRDGQLYFQKMSSSSGTEDRSYEKVKILEIASGSGSLQVTFGRLAMQNLEVLKAGSGLQFTELTHLTKLKAVYAIGSHDDILKQHLEDKLKDHPCQPRPKNVALPTVVSTEGSQPQESTEGNDQRYSFPFYPTHSVSTSTPATTTTSSSTPAATGSSPVPVEDAEVEGEALAGNEQPALETRPRTRKPSSKVFGLCCANTVEM